jgi:hypothetical protein
MARITLEINGREESFETLWVHLQQVDRATAIPYRIQVPNEDMTRVFDPLCAKSGSESWPEYLKKMIEELGTFIVEAYLRTMANIRGEDNRKFRWIVATVDDVVEIKDGIELTGKAMPFRPRA